jgi:hypothetical protein
MLTNEQKKQVRRAVLREVAIMVVCFSVGFFGVRLIGV